jgi:molybdopterin-biosynthesis enzyme MoeA-like protein
MFNIPFMKTAQILIIGDEILSGRTQDSNSNYLASALFKRGIRVKNIDVISDNFILISQWVHQKHALSDYTFICGGIGGTPDDVTRPAVAAGVGVGLERNVTAEKLLSEYYKEKINPDRMSMADLPQGCTLIDNPMTLAPGFKIKNIYVMAGVPMIMKVMFKSIENELNGSPLFEAVLNLAVGEGEIAKHMKTLNKKYPLLELGSYPNMEDATKGYRTQMVFRAIDKNTVDSAMVDFKTLCAESHIHI